jgi:hypothetical protein
MIRFTESDIEEAATNTVLEQAELLAADWA